MILFDHLPKPEREVRPTASFGPGKSTIPRDSMLVAALLAAELTEPDAAEGEAPTTVLATAGLVVVEPVPLAAVTGTISPTVATAVTHAKTRTNDRFFISPPR